MVIVPRQLSVLVITILIEAATLFPVDAMAAQRDIRSCIRGCRAQQRACVKVALDDYETNRRVCGRATSREAKLCGRGHRQRLRTDKQACREVFQATCRPCCRTGSTGCLFDGTTIGRCLTTCASHRKACLQAARGDHRRAERACAAQPTSREVAACELSAEETLNATKVECRKAFRSLCEAGATDTAALCKSATCQDRSVKQGFPCMFPPLPSQE
jgi:hypothetical protein